MIVKLRNVRMAFPHLWEPTAYEEGQPKKYSGAFLIAKSDKQIATINAAIKHEAVGLWGAKADSVLSSIRGNNMKYCFQDGDLRTTSGYEGHFYLTAKDSAQPFVCDCDPNTKLTAASGRPYGGCYVNAHINIYASKKNGNAIRASLKGVQFVKDGPAFAGGPPATPEDFDNISDFGSEEPVMSDLL